MEKYRKPKRYCDNLKKTIPTIKTNTNPSLTSIERVDYYIFYAVFVYFVYSM